MRVPWPLIKASHLVRGHGCFPVGTERGALLRARDINLIPCYVEVVASPLRVLLGRCRG